MRELRVIRGLPGAGKSFLAQRMKDAEGAVVFNNDELLTVAGVYQWNEERALQAHWTNQCLVADAMRQGVPVIVLDNTNLLPYHVSPYVRLGKYYGYQHRIVQVETPWCQDIDELVKRNTHAVTKSVLEKMQGKMNGVPVESLEAVLRWEIAMDPEVALRLAQTFLEEGNFLSADEQMFDYEDWCHIGGFSPEGGSDVAESIGNKLQEWRANFGRTQ